MRRAPVIKEPVPPWQVRGGWKPAQHGTRSMYNRGCACDPCRVAERVYQRARQRVR